MSIVNRSQSVRRLGAALGRQPGPEGAAIAGVGGQHGGPADLGVGGADVRGAVAQPPGVPRDAVQHDPRIAPQVLTLAGLRHRPDPQLAVVEVRIGAAQPRRAITTDGAQHRVRRRRQDGADAIGEVRFDALDVVEAGHRRSLAEWWMTSTTATRRRLLDPGRLVAMVIHRRVLQLASDGVAVVVAGCLAHEVTRTGPGPRAHVRDDRAAATSSSPGASAAAASAMVSAAGQSVRASAAPRRHPTAEADCADEKGMIATLDGDADFSAGARWRGGCVVGRGCQRDGRRCRRSRWLFG